MNSSAANNQDLPQRKSLPHDVPSWVKSGEVFFITICCTPRGMNQLCSRAISEAIFESVRHRHERNEWFVRLVLLMPDHLHALISFPADQAMPKSIRLWKGFLARQHGIKWQRDFFDHRIRNGEQWMFKADYIRRNPVRAGLVTNPEKWPYVWEPT